MALRRSLERVGKYYLQVSPLAAVGGEDVDGWVDGCSKTGNACLLDAPELQCECKSQVVIRTGSV